LIPTVEQVWFYFFFYLNLPFVFMLGFRWRR
jgi:hypothetical protein